MKDGVNDPAVRAKLAKELSDLQKQAAASAPTSDNTSDAKKKTQRTPSSSSTSPRTSPSSSSWVHRVVNMISNWLLIAVVLIILAWARHIVDPLSHLVGFQVAVSDVAVIDGDTFKARIFPERSEAKFRLRLVDAPELTQPFGSEAAEILLDILSSPASSTAAVVPDPTAASTGASSSSSSLSLSQHQFLNREVILSIVGRDPDTGAYWADAVVRDSVYLNTSSVQLELVERGAAWAHRGFHSAKHPSVLVKAMLRARERRVGLWAALPSAVGAAGGDDDDDDNNAPVEPWEFVRAQQQEKKAKKKAKKKKSTQKKDSEKK